MWYADASMGPRLVRRGSILFEVFEFNGEPAGSFNGAAPGSARK